MSASLRREEAITSECRNGWIGPSCRRIPRCVMVNSSAWQPSTAVTFGRYGAHGVAANTGLTTAIMAESLLDVKCRRHFRAAMGFREPREGLGEGDRRLKTRLMPPRARQRSSSSAGEPRQRAVRTALRPLTALGIQSGEATCARVVRSNKRRRHVVVDADRLRL